MDKYIYHGSKHIVRRPEFGIGNAFNDFGLGFYCSESAKGAASWAAGRGSSGFISAYILNTDRLRIINLCGSSYTLLHWLAVLFNFRVFDFSSEAAYRGREYINKHFSVDYQGSDCILGYRADDVCFKLAQDFICGRLSYQSLRAHLTGEPLNRQFVLKSNRAFESITFDGYEPVYSELYYAEDYSKELHALKASKSRTGKNDMFIEDMIREDISAYDARL